MCIHIATYLGGLQVDKARLNTWRGPPQASNRLICANQRGLQQPCSRAPSLGTNREASRLAHFTIKALSASKDAIRRCSTGTIRRSWTAYVEVCNASVPEAHSSATLQTVHGHARSSKESGRIKISGHYNAVIGSWNSPWPGLRRLRMQPDRGWLSGRAIR